MLDHLAALADDDALLPLALDVNRGVHAQDLLSLLERVTDDAHGVRDLVAGATQDLLAHKLSHEVSSDASVPMSSGNQRGPSGKK